ncbi:MAG: glutamyl-tRNA reductase [Gammaproteobacteria bacterium]|nr:glutamyl-tRNA reductase [Gammaproteobacteria bacterium]
MALLTLALSHHRAPVEVRSRAAFTDDELGDALVRLRALPGVGEACVLSTCNRTELTAVVAADAPPDLLGWWQRERSLPAGLIEPLLQTHRELGSVLHQLRVACGLDSMVVGESQILGQMKQAYTRARQQQTLGPVLERLFQHAFAVAKQVRSATHIGANPVSVAYAAVQLAERIFADFRGQTALLIGAGDTAKLLSRHLRKRDIGRLLIANRSPERARRLAAELGGLAIGLNDMAAYLPQADLVIASTGARGYLLSPELVETARRGRRRKPVLMIDLAVPRDLDPAIAGIEDVYLYSLDDLHGVIAENLKAREVAARQAEVLVEDHARNFIRWLESRDVAPVIRDLHARAREHRDLVLERARRRLAAGADPQEVLGFVADTLAQRLLHAPSAALKRTDAVEQALLLSATRKLFDLPEDAPERGR